MSDSVVLIAPSTRDVTYCLTDGRSYRPDQTGVVHALPADVAELLAHGFREKDTSPPVPPTRRARTK